jgi:Acetyltransferase (GNAT) family
MAGGAKRAMIVREATAADWGAVSEFFLSTPLESGTVFVLDRRPDFGALPGLRGVFRTFLALEGERLAGTVTALCRKAGGRNQEVAVGEVIDLRVAGWARGGRAAFLLLQAAYEAFKERDVDWIVCLIGDENRATLPLVTRRAGFPALMPLAEFASVHFVAWRVPVLPEPNGLTVRAAGATDDAVVASLAAETVGREFLAPAEPLVWPDAAGLHRAWIASAADGTPCGMLMIWDGEPVRRLRILRYRRADLPLRVITHVGAWLGVTARMPSPGGVLGLWASRVVTIMHGGSVTLRALLRAALRDATVAGRSVVQLNLHGLDPLLRELPRYPRSTYRSTLYGCPCRGDAAPGYPAERYYADLSHV